MFDVGQGESILIERPRGRTMLVDTGGAPFGGGVDVGSRVLAPALWARGIRSLDTLLITHGDPDHLGGALAVLGDFAPHRLWMGVAVPNHRPTLDVLDAAARVEMPVEFKRRGEADADDDLRVRVLHPPPPDWERRRVRNDDSVVLEIVYRDVAVLLTGDVSEQIEREILPQLTHAKTRILKVAHHGSRTSSSMELLSEWRPQFALISAGRGNTFGHPTQDVLRRLEAIHAVVFRTDRDGQITLETDGHQINVEDVRGEIVMSTELTTKITNTKLTKVPSSHGLRIPSPLSPEADLVMSQTIGCAIAVHRALGPGFIESIYRKAMCIELESRNLALREGALDSSEVSRS